MNALLSGQHLMSRELGGAMAGRRKIFRIEETARLGVRSEADQAPALHAALMAEINALRAVLASGSPQQPENGQAAPGIAANPQLAAELERLAAAIDSGHEERSAAMMRIAAELEAVVTSTERATQKVLAAAEEIDQLANNLSAALKDKIEQGVAQDIQDYVLEIFESCNFQDLAGQRIAKVVGALKLIDGQIAQLIAEFNKAAAEARRGGAGYLHGPRLDTDRGHASQDDVDAMFSYG